MNRELKHHADRSVNVLTLYKHLYMIANVVKIGNSHYVLLAKKMLDSYGIEDKVRIMYEEGFIKIEPYHEPRSGWTEMYRNSFADQGTEDELLPGEYGLETMDDED